MDVYWTKKTCQLSAASKLCIRAFITHHQTVYHQEVGFINMFIIISSQFACIIQYYRSPSSCQGNIIGFVCIIIRIHHHQYKSNIIVVYIQYCSHYIFHHCFYSTVCIQHSYSLILLENLISKHAIVSYLHFIHYYHPYTSISTILYFATVFI